LSAIAIALDIFGAANVPKNAIDFILIPANHISAPTTSVNAADGNLSTSLPANTFKFRSEASHLIIKSQSQHRRSRRKWRQNRRGSCSAAGRLTTGQ
jgi:hypothetical protein